MKKGVLRNLAKFTRKHLCQSPQACSFIEKETLVQVFCCEVYKISKTSILQNNPGRLLLGLY